MWSMGVEGAYKSMGCRHTCMWGLHGAAWSWGEKGRLGAGGQVSPLPPFCLPGQVSEGSEISKLNLAFQAVMKF